MSSIGNAEEPPAKKQKHIIGSSDRITVDVGGTKFTTAKSTLTSNSEYFASLLSGNWGESSDNEIFLDRNPSAFGKLIEYMREGMIKVDDIDESVLTLAEFLGIERLLLAIKVRWYHNIGKGPVLSSDEEIASAFDERYGGIRNAIYAGLVPYFLKQDDINAEKEFALFKIEPDRVHGHGLSTYYSIKMIGEPGSDFQPVSDIIEALNSLHMKGYNVHESQLRLLSKSRETLTFSRRRHFTLQSEVTGIFIPGYNETKHRRERKGTKQFAMLKLNRDDEGISILAPFEFDQNDPMIRVLGPNATGEIPNACCESWLEKSGFMTCEVEYEDVFQKYFDSEHTRYHIRVFSRVVEHVNGDQPDS